MPVTRSYLDGPWGQVHARVRPGGPDGRTVLLFHESPVTSRVYDGVLAAAGDTHTWMALDTPGHGGSAPPPAECDLPAYAAALLAALGERVTGGFVAVGVHTGAVLALEAVRQAGPRRALGLVMSGVGLYDDAQRAWMQQHWCPPVELTPDGAQYAWAIERYRRIYGPDTPPWMLHAAVHQVMAGIEHYTWAYQASFRYEAGPALAAVTTPALLLNAEGDMFADRDAAVRDLLGGPAEIRLLRGIAGQPHLRRPREYAQAVEAFTDELSAPAR